ncbi:MAG: hypothetical protein KDB03_09150 [Planctomycetales bacterium]|nr:hypothetical protein [Planctomycetales bacterium]
MSNDSNLAGSRLPINRWLLYATLLLVVIGTCLAIAAVLRQSWTWYETMVILSTVILAIGSLCGLACELSRKPKGINLLPNLGTALTILGSALLLVGAWLSIEIQFYWQFSANIVVLAIATCHVCLLSIVSLPGSYQWAYWIALQLIYGLALIICMMIDLELFNSGEGIFRLIAVMSILAVALSMLIPVLGRIARTRGNRTSDMLTMMELRSVSAIDREIEMLRLRIEKLETLRHELVASEGSSIQGARGSG